jgi:dethiobiotin synthetase
VGQIFFISGIDTDAGKSYATGILARRLAAAGQSVVTMKMIQTGCPAGAVSEDILTHRRLMGIPPLPEDLDGTTCPVRLTWPASPDMAARVDGVDIDLSAIDRAAQTLAARYDTVLMEGAGGVLVPIEGLFTMADYAAKRRLPLILVTGPRLGSVNHTLLSLEACGARGIRVAQLVYNLHGETSPEITADTRRYLMRWLECRQPFTEFIEIGIEIF